LVGCVVRFFGIELKEHQFLGGGIGSFEPGRGERLDALERLQKELRMWKGPGHSVEQPKASFRFDE
jgi:hypothetical protein